MILMNSVSPESELPKTCPLHPSEKVRYFCRDCKTAVCPDCVVDHARHDFIIANEDAAHLVGMELANLGEKVR